METAVPPPVFGSFAPNAAQALLLHAASVPVLRRGFFRRLICPVVVALGGEPLDVVRGQVRFRLSPSCNVAERGILLNSLYQEDSLRFLREVLPPGGWMVDCGANVGQFSLHGGIAVGAGGKVLAVEASSEMAARLKANIVLSGLTETVSVANLAVGDKDGSIAFEINDTDGALSRAHPAGLHEVVMRPLLALIKQAGFPRIDLLKIDVEGMEDKVLTPFFRDAPAEMWPDHIIIEDELSGLWDSDILLFLKEHGYIEATQRAAGNVFFSLQKQDNSHG